ncbi:hypothetical protein [Streptomyces roseochromogenus]|uniref:hypothetical protein n=1 Tax=Streptomyces roseochromogenus TaxID=285450 RepID=UPI00131A1873|nr:hypothetical protein [Streptomyces roseochromogenus]
MAEIEGLYTALLRTKSPGRHERLRAELTRAAEHLAALAVIPGQGQTASHVARRRSRRERRSALAERGAAWIIKRYGQNAH